MLVGVIVGAAVVVVLVVVVVVVVGLAVVAVAVTVAVVCGGAGGGGGGGGSHCGHRPSNPRMPVSPASRSEVHCSVAGCQSVGAGTAFEKRSADKGKRQHIDLELG